MIALLALLAEISDKEPSLLKLWLIAAVLSAASLLLGSWRRWLGVIPGMLAVVCIFAVWPELHDAILGPAIQRELGRNYVLQAYATTMLPIVFVVFALFRNRRFSA